MAKSKFNFGAFKTALSKMGKSKEFNSFRDRTFQDVKDLAAQKGTPENQLVVATEKQTAGKILKAYTAAQTADEFANYLYDTPVVGSIVKVVGNIPDYLVKYTIGQIPGIKDKLASFMSGFYDGMASFIDAIGFQGFAKQGRHGAEIWRNHGEWYPEGNQTVQVDEDFNVISNENANAKVVLAGMITHALDLSWVRSQYIAGTPAVELQRALDKWKTALNYQQSIDNTDIGTYIAAVAEMYACYVSLKKHYDNRNARVVKGQSLRFNEAYVDGPVRASNLGLRSTHTNLDDGYKSAVFTAYISNKVWDQIDMFIETCYLPDSLKQFIEYACGNYFKYSKDTNTYFNIDFGYSLGVYDLDNPTAPHTIAEQIIDYYIPNVEAARVACTASIEGFLAKFGYKQISIPDTLKNRRSKVGEETPKYKLCDSFERAAINNTFIYKEVPNTDGFGYKFDADTDTIIISNENEFKDRFTDVVKNDSTELRSTKVARACKLLKFWYYTDFYCAALWGRVANGTPTKILWSDTDVILANSMSTGDTINSTVMQNTITNLQNMNGVQVGGTDLFDALSFECRYDGHTCVTFKASPTVVTIPKESAYCVESEEKIYKVSVIKELCNLSIAFSKQYRDNLYKYIKDMNQAIDNNL